MKIVLGEEEKNLLTDLTTTVGDSVGYSEQKTNGCHERFLSVGRLYVMFTPCSKNSKGAYVRTSFYIQDGTLAFCFKRNDMRKFLALKMSFRKLLRSAVNVTVRTWDRDTGLSVHTIVNLEEVIDCLDALRAGEQWSEFQSLEDEMEIQQ